MFEGTRHELPQIGQPIVFLAFGGRDRVAAVVTRIHQDGSIALTTFPYGGGSIYHDRVPRHVPGEALHAWEPVEPGEAPAAPAPAPAKPAPAKPARKRK